MAKQAYTVGQTVWRTLPRDLTREQAMLVITEVDVPGSDNRGKARPAVRAQQPAYPSRTAPTWLHCEISADMPERFR